MSFILGSYSLVNSTQLHVTPEQHKVLMTLNEEQEKVVSELIQQKEETIQEALIIEKMNQFTKDMITIFEKCSLLKNNPAYADHVYKELEQSGVCETIGEDFARFAEETRESIKYCNVVKAQMAQKYRGQKLEHSSPSTAR